MNDTTCPICLQEERKEDEIATLGVNCSHSFCKSCLTHWIEYCESSKPQALPGCPTCRVPINTWDIVRLSGRPFQERLPIAADEIKEDPEEELDEFFQTWLEENGAVKCINCHIWVTKNGGCDSVFCTWCDRSFCFDCAQKGVPCTGHGYWEPEPCDYCGALDCQSACLFEPLVEDRTTEFIDCAMDGMKNGRGGKKRLLWKGNARSGKCTKTRRGGISMKRSNLASSSKTRTQSKGDKRNKRSSGKKANRGSKAQVLALTS
ncbi:expressed unknown protein [Seminavis robusta]|uniref:RING-type domain-containing protein n=1 Tax=Seminavis robusta TaxID=568900 RepID=A0A9N8DAU0_9STRA|nr:expressed unknown protein [Seminavis robusta]|eukprot:Sro64_g036440.1 n/a (262) ;mRNA; f:109769-110554